MKTCILLLIVVAVASARCYQYRNWEEDLELGEQDKYTPTFCRDMRNKYEQALKNSKTAETEVLRQRAKEMSEVYLSYVEECKKSRRVLFELEELLELIAEQEEEEQELGFFKSEQEKFAPTFCKDMRNKYQETLKEAKTAQSEVLRERAESMLGVYQKYIDECNKSKRLLF